MIGHEVEVAHRLALVVGRGAEQDRIAELAGPIVSRLDELRKEWVGDVGDDQAQRPRSLHPERARDAGWSIAEFVGRALHRGGRRGSRAPDACEDPAHGGRRHGRAERHIADRDPGRASGHRSHPAAVILMPECNRFQQAGEDAGLELAAYRLARTALPTARRRSWVACIQSVPLGRYRFGIFATIV